jgi:Na+-driven multidrug efflux pump
MPLAVDYSRLMLVASPLYVIFIVYTSLMRGAGELYPYPQLPVAG